MRIFVAADWKHRLEAREAMRWLERRGHRVTCDWTTETGKTADVLASIASRDARGVMSADVLLVLMNGRGPYRGVWFEIGMALALGKPVVCLGKRRLDCVYGYHLAILTARNLPEAEAVLEREVDASPRLLPVFRCRGCEHDR